MENSGAEETTNAQTLLLGKCIGYADAEAPSRIMKATSDELVTLPKRLDLWLFITSTI
jgi:hypothetical protein